jgi:hypothetical protein
VRAYEEAVAHADRLDGSGEAPRPLPQPAPASEDEPAVEGASGPARAPRPAIPLKESITEYTPRELEALVAWIQSDGRLRTDDEIVTEVSRELQFARRGRRIVEAIEAAIRRVRS